MTSQATLIRLLRGLSIAAQECFFDALARELTEVLGVDFAFIAELVEEEPLRGRTVAFYGEGRRRENVSFRLRHTPCIEVLENGYRFVPSDVRTCFPDDTLFQQLGIEGYAGIVLIDEGALIGWIAVLHREPLPEEEIVRAVLEFMAARTSAELRARILHEALVIAQTNALRDELTALPNRTHFTQQLEVALDSTRPLAVLFLDLDRFKVINDSLGHTAGDLLLTAAARRIRDSVRPCDFVARHGGDEFVILLDAADDAEAAEVARRIELELEKPFAIDDQDVYTSASIGIACGRGQYRSAGEILRDADTAMNRAKAAGKACFRIFHAGMHVDAVDRMQIEMDLRRAIDRDQLHLVYQPIVTTRERNIVGYEALLRWRHPSRGMIMPGTFIPIAEETGIIVPVGEWVLDRVCADINDRDLGGAIVNVNLSALQLQQHDIVERIDGIVRSRSVAPRRVRLEVTESAIAANPDAAARALHAIRDLGIQLCIDDFGIGYSSLASLLRFPFTSLKLDRSLIGGVTESAEHRQMVGAITSLAHTLGLDIVAEGVETAEQYAIVEEAGIDFVQGFYISVPRPLDEILTPAYHFNADNRVE